MQIHRCPATVSGTKSAGTTEALGLGKVQRVETRREPGDLPYRALRRPFEGKGRQLVQADPDRSWSGFFYVCCFPLPCALHFFPPWGGREGEGEQAVVPPAAFPPSFLQPSLHRHVAPGSAARVRPRGAGRAHAACVVSGHNDRSRAMRPLSQPSPGISLSCSSPRRRLNSARHARERRAMIATTDVSHIQEAP